MYTTNLCPALVDDNKKTLSFPECSVEAFQDVLNYIYLGKVTLKTDNILDILMVASELRLDKLKQNAESFVYDAMTVDNACNMMDKAMKITGPDGDLFNQCMEFVEEHAEDCIDSDGWLQISKQTLCKLISSDHFSVEEDLIWQSVLSWAKYQVGISEESKPVDWSEEEKEKIKQVMEGVPEHIRLLQLTSSTFAEEVEPTGLIPIETALKYYRCAAVPHKFRNLDDPLLIPRTPLNLFQGTQILNKNNRGLQKKLNEWHGKLSTKWELLYRASRDGSTADRFHHFCDGYAPTYIIMKGKNGNVAGGFSDVPWTSCAPAKGLYRSSYQAFLFTLINKQDVPPSKFRVLHHNFATVHHPSYGPIFGAGADLSISGNCFTGCECYTNLPHSYLGDQASNKLLMDSYYFDLADYEVFTPIR
ncbi:uncharacterized protein LOC141898131 [Tubulanus polymorphus]|uniref:uncharacterized protein LOC141898131 n=1 Tax=Tubulanus polymorphus TaxID=672921 RepID=UPI003DA367DA